MKTFSDLDLRLISFALTSVGNQPVDQKTKGHARNLARSIEHALNGGSSTIKTVTVNGSKVQTDDYEWSYSDVLDHAHETAGASMMWGGKNGSGGSLIAGESVVLVDGMHFSCVHTGNA